MDHMLVAPIGRVDGGVLHAIEGSLRRTFGHQTDCVEALAETKVLTDPNGQRQNSMLILGALAHRFRRRTMKLLAVTEQDLFLPMFTFIYGQAQLGGRVGILSLARLRQEFYGLAADSELLRERACKEALHEMGHTFGLVHCRHESCVMSASIGIQWIDDKRGEFCSSCRNLLGHRAVPATAPVRFGAHNTGPAQRVA
jgi:archaemetzincin